MKLSTKIILSVLSGILIILSFPTVIGPIKIFSWGWLAWIGFVPLILATEGEGVRRTLLLAFICTGIYFCGSYYWLIIALRTYGGLGWTTTGITYFTLCFIMAVEIALAFSLANFIERRVQISRLWSLPFLFAAAEFMRNYLFSGFSWSNIGYSQHAYLPVIQILDITGIYGLCALLLLSNVTVAGWYQKVVNRGSSAPIFLSIFLVVLLLVVLIYGSARITSFSKDKGEEQISVALLQGNISQNEKWRPDLSKKIFYKYLDLSIMAGKQGAQLIIWPEAALPYTIETDMAEVPVSLPSDLDADLLIGAVGVEPEIDGEIKSYNSAFLMDSKGRILDRSDKSQLVPFGEYVPMKRLLSFLDKITQAVGDFHPGQHIHNLKTKGHLFGVLICYEDIFPEISRKLARQGATFLVTITNDAWYGRTSAPYQHMGINIFRAVENRLAAVRAANTGVSGVIDPVGRVIYQSDIFVDDTIIRSIPIMSERSIYTKWGDWFAWGCVIISLIMLAASLRSKFSR